MWLPSYVTPFERLTRTLVVAFAVAVLLFLIAPLFIIVPLSFSKDPFFTLPVREYSLRWYADFFGNARWMNAIFNSAVAAVMTTVLATTLVTSAWAAGWAIAGGVAGQRAARELTRTS